MGRCLYFIYLIILIFQLFCVEERKTVKDIRVYREPKGYNIKFIGYDININNPERDRRAYYKVYIDKLEVGRTTIGLESQLKTFEYKIQSNRHLLMVEKYALDEKRGKYIKLNNIEQPKPNFIYFNLPLDKVVVITLINDIIYNKSSFGIDVE
ncbi:MAG: hypothetical protein SVZ03_16180 [Spirochaetota bacterium]|nr:hypothetical protein [Spirochaetota bacterium]